MGPTPSYFHSMPVNTSQAPLSEAISFTFDPSMFAVDSGPASAGRPPPPAGRGIPGPGFHWNRMRLPSGDQQAPVRHDAAADAEHERAVPADQFGERGLVPRGREPTKEV